YRDAVLELAEIHPFARPLVNSGRLSRPATLHDSPLNTPDDLPWSCGVPPGAPASDAPLHRDGRTDWLLPHLGRTAFPLLLFGDPAHVSPDALAPLAKGGFPILPVCVTPSPQPNAWHDHRGLAAARYNARPGTAILFRPDQHVAGRWRHFNATAIA